MGAVEGDLWDPSAIRYRGLNLFAERFDQFAALFPGTDWTASALSERIEARVLSSPMSCMISRRPRQRSKCRGSGSSPLDVLHLMDVSFFR